MSTATASKPELIRIQMRASTAVNMSGGGVIRLKAGGVYDIPREYAEKWCHPRQRLAVVFGEPLELEREDQGFESGIVFAPEVSAAEAHGGQQVNALEKAATPAEMRSGFAATTDTTSFNPGERALDHNPDVRAVVNNELASQLREVQASKGK